MHTHTQTHACMYTSNIQCSPPISPPKEYPSLSKKHLSIRQKNPFFHKGPQFFRQRPPFLRQRIISNEKKENLVSSVYSQMLPLCDGSFAENSLSLVNTNLFSSAYSLLRRLFCEGSFAKAVWRRIFSRFSPQRACALLLRIAVKTCMTTRWRRPIGCLKLQVISRQKPLIIGLLCGK